MRIAVAVVVGCVLLSFGPAARAEEAPRKRDEVCLDGCNFVFEKCQAKAGPKGDGRCSVEVVRCKKECPYETVEVPAVPTAKSQQRCVDDCRDAYKKCQGLAANRAGGNCQAEDMRCEKACPKPPEPVVAAAPTPASGSAATSATASDAAAAPPVAAPAPAVPAKPRRAARVEGAAAPAPISATPAVPAGERAGATAPTVRSEAVTPPAVAPTEASPAVARPAQSERGFFGKLACFFRSCEPAGSTPCLQQCSTAYDQCRAQESKRGGECNTRLMRCRQSCREPAPAAP
jgi:hypothetical protein